MTHSIYIKDPQTKKKKKNRTTSAASAGPEHKRESDGRILKISFPSWELAQSIFSIHSFLLKTLFSFLNCIFLSLFQDFQSWIHLKLKKKLKSELLGFSSISGIFIFLLALLFLRKIYKRTSMYIYLNLTCNLKCKMCPRIKVELHMGGSSGNRLITLVSCNWRVL